MSEETTSTPGRRDAASAGEVIEYVKTYAKQETVGPLKGAGRWIGLGAAGSVALGLGLMLLALGLLRMLQAEWSWSSSRGHSWVNYLIVVAFLGVALGLTLWRINQTFLNKEDKR